MSRVKDIERITAEVCDMLVQKNLDYGDSALHPINVFSNGNAVDSLNARIDDKLARIHNVGLSDETEDTLFDLIGYLILLVIAKEDEAKLEETDPVTATNSLSNINPERTWWTTTST
jgi:hypothetical protein